MPVGLFYLHFESVHFQFKRCLVKFLLYICFIEIPVLHANTVDPDQRPRSMASDPGLHCLPISLLWDARHKWVKESSCSSLYFYYH